MELFISYCHKDESYIDNFIKSVELQDNIANSILTSSYYTLRLS